MKKISLKTTPAKLTLSRETLQRLDSKTLEGVLSGAGTYPSFGCTNNCTGPNCQVH